jgi:hypothetical protein
MSPTNTSSEVLFHTKTAEYSGLAFNRTDFYSYKEKPAQIMDYDCVSQLQFPIFVRFESP